MIDAEKAAVARTAYGEAGKVATGTRSQREAARWTAVFDAVEKFVLDREGIVVASGGSK